MMVNKELQLPGDLASHEEWRHYLAQEFTKSLKQVCDLQALLDEVEKGLKDEKINLQRIAGGILTIEENVNSLLLKIQEARRK